MSELNKILDHIQIQLNNGIKNCDNNSYKSSLSKNIVYINHPNQNVDNPNLKNEMEKFMNEITSIIDNFKKEIGEFSLLKSEIENLKDDINIIKNSSKENNEENEKN